MNLLPWRGTKLAVIVWCVARLTFLSRTNASMRVRSRPTYLIKLLTIESDRIRQFCRTNCPTSCFRCIIISQYCHRVSKDSSTWSDVLPGWPQSARLVRRGRKEMRKVRMLDLSKSVKLPALASVKKLFSKTLLSQQKKRLAYKKMVVSTKTSLTHQQRYVKSHEQFVVTWRTRFTSSLTVD